MPDRSYRDNKITIRGGEGFVRAASFVGNLIECGVLGHELVRRHLVKPLIVPHCGGHGDTNVFRASAIYQLFYAARNTLLRGLLEPEDIKVCFETLDTQVGHISGSSIAGKLPVRCVTHSSASLRNLTGLVRNFARSISHGWRGSGMESKWIPRKLKKAGGRGGRDGRRSPCRG